MKNGDSDQDSNSLKDRARDTNPDIAAKADLSQLMVTDAGATSSLFKQMHSSGRDVSSDSDNPLTLAAAGTSLVGLIAVPGARELVKFRDQLASSDLPATARDVKERVGTYSIKPSDSSLPATLEFKNSNVSLQDKLRLALVEMQARDERAFYILHNGDQIAISKSDSPDHVLQRYADLQERRNASGVPYNIREIGLGVNSISFPNGVDPEKAIKATIAESQARRSSFSLSLDGTYIGMVDSKSNFDAVKKTFDAAQKRNVDAAEVRKSAGVNAESLRSELKYSVKDSPYSNNGVDLRLKSLPAEAKLDSVVDAAIAEAKARGKTVTITVGDESYTSVDANANRDRKIADFKKAIDRSSAREEAHSLRDDLGYQFAKGSNSSAGNSEILFPANTTPESRIRAAVAEATSLDSKVNFNYDGVKMTVSPRTDLAQAQADYKSRWDAHQAQAVGGSDLQKEGHDLSGLKYTVDNLKSEYSKDGEISFRRGTALEDKVRAAVAEARARNQGLYFDDDGHRVFVSAGEKTADKLAQFQAEKARADAGGYTVGETSYNSVSLDFKPGTPAEKIAAATIAERDARVQAKGRQPDISYRIGGEYGGSPKGTDSVADVTRAIESKTSARAVQDSARQELEQKAQAFRDELKYSISKGEFSSYQMKVGSSTPLDKAAEAAIAEAKAKSASVAMSKDGVTTYVSAEDSPQDVLRSYNGRREADSWRATADGLKSRLGYEVSFDKLQPKLKFPPETSAEERVSAALAEAKARQQNVSFTYDGLRTTISPSDDSVNATQRYFEQYGRHKEEQATKLAQQQFDAQGKEVPKLRMADISRIVQDYGRVGDSIESREAFIAAVHDTSARSRFLQTARNDDERRAFNDMLDKAGAMPADEFAAFKENLAAKTELRSGMSTMSKVGIGVGLLAVVSAGLYVAQEKYRQSRAEAEAKSKTEKKVPFFKPD